MRFVLILIQISYLVSQPINNLNRKSIFFSGQLCGYLLNIIPLLNSLYRSAHPSPLSAHKGFLGNGHFQKANEWLAKNYGKDAQINWTVLSAK